MRHAKKRNKLGRDSAHRKSLMANLSKELIDVLSGLAGTNQRSQSEIARLEAAREVLTDAQFSAVQWAAITIGTFNRLSILSEYPVQERALDRKKKAEARHG